MRSTVSWFNFSILFIAMLLFFSNQASAAPIGNLTLNQTNQTTVGTPINFSFSFTFPNSYNYTNITVEFPSSFGIISATPPDVTQIDNYSNIPANCDDYSGYTLTMGGSGSNVTANQFSCSANFTANTTFYTWNVSIIKLPVGNGSYDIKVYAEYESAAGVLIGIDGPNTLTGLQTSPDYIVNVTTSIAAGTASNVSGNIFNITATAQDRYGNTNLTGGFNFRQNDTGILRYFSGLGGNGTIYAIFNATRNGTANVNVSFALNSSVWNNTGAGTNLTVNASSIVGLNLTFNATSIVAGGAISFNATGFDLNGNINTTGGFDSYGNASGITQTYGNQSGDFFQVFNLTRNGTFSFNVSAKLNSSAWNATGPNVTVSSANIIFVNISSSFPTHSNSSVSASLNGTFSVGVFAVDRFGNLNFTGGFNFTSANHSIAVLASGNTTNTGVFNTSLLSGTVTAVVYSAADPTASNGSLTLNSTVHPALGSAAASGITSNAATITWSTQEGASTILEYGATAGYGSNSTSSTLVTAHSVALTGLLSSTTYHYRVHSCSGFNLCSFSSDATFTTGVAPGQSSGGSPGGGAPGGEPVSPAPEPESPTPSVPSAPSEGVPGGGGGAGAPQPLVSQEQASASQQALAAVSTAFERAKAAFASVAANIKPTPQLAVIAMVSLFLLLLLAVGVRSWLGGRKKKHVQLHGEHRSHSHRK